MRKFWNKILGCIVFTQIKINPLVNLQFGIYDER